MSKFVKKNGKRSTFDNVVRTNKVFLGKFIPALLYAAVPIILGLLFSPQWLPVIAICQIFFIFMGIIWRITYDEIEDGDLP